MQSIFIEFSRSSLGSRPSDINDIVLFHNDMCTDSRIDFKQMKLVRLNWIQPKSQLLKSTLIVHKYYNPSSTLVFLANMTLHFIRSFCHDFFSNQNQRYYHNVLKKKVVKVKTSSFKNTLDSDSQSALHEFIIVEKETIDIYSHFTHLPIDNSILPIITIHSLTHFKSCIYASMDLGTHLIIKYVKRKSKMRLQFSLYLLDLLIHWNANECPMSFMLHSVFSEWMTHSSINVKTDQGTVSGEKILAQTEREVFLNQTPNI
jgi:hypothetical protein